jgi:hypothetical protein
VSIGTERARSSIQPSAMYDVELFECIHEAPADLVTAYQHARSWTAERRVRTAAMGQLARLARAELAAVRFTPVYDAALRTMLEHGKRILATPVIALDYFNRPYESEEPVIREIDEQLAWHAMATARLSGAREAGAWTLGDAYELLGEPRWMLRFVPDAAVRAAHRLDRLAARFRPVDEDEREMVGAILRGEPRGTAMYTAWKRRNRKSDRRNVLRELHRSRGSTLPHDAPIGNPFRPSLPPS